MSYILEALRRAEADRERERGQVPGLHTQPPSGSEAAPSAGQRRWLTWAGTGLLLLAGIGIGSWWASGQHEAPSPVALPVPQPMPAPLVPTARPTAVAAAPVIQPAPVTSLVASPGTQQPGTQQPVRPAASGSPYLPPTPPPAPAPAPAAEARIPRLSELPESTRRELPKLAIAGLVYSDDPASRLPWPHWWGWTGSRPR